MMMNMRTLDMDHVLLGVLLIYFFPCLLILILHKHTHITTIKSFLVFTTF